MHCSIVALRCGTRYRVRKSSEGLRELHPHIFISWEGLVGERKVRGVAKDPNLLSNRQLCTRVKRRDERASKRPKGRNRPNSQRNDPSMTSTTRGDLISILSYISDNVKIKGERTGPKFCGLHLWMVRSLQMPACLLCGVNSQFPRLYNRFRSATKANQWLSCQIYWGSFPSFNVQEQERLSVGCVNCHLQLYLG